MKILVTISLLLSLTVVSIGGAVSAHQSAVIEVEMEVVDIGNLTDNRGSKLATTATVRVTNHEPIPLELVFSTWHENRHTQSPWTTEGGPVRLESKETSTVTIRARMNKSGVLLSRPAQLQARDVRSGRLAVHNFLPKRYA